MHFEEGRSMRKGPYPEIGSVEVRKKIGEEIRSAREFQQLSIEEIAETTKISIRYIEAIEKGDWSFLPPTYIQAFIRSIAITAGLDAQDIERRLSDIFSAEIMQHGLAQATPQEEVINLDQPGRMMTWAEQHRSIIFYGLVGLVAVVLVIIYLASPSRSPERIAETLLKQETRPVKVVVPKPVLDTAKTVVQAPREVTPTPGQSESGTWKLELYAFDTCYVKIEQGDSVIYERTLWPRNRIMEELSAEIRLSLGNAPGIRLILNGDTLAAFEAGRRVIITRVGRNGLIH
jgi:cytoskeletal protein RodZ